MYFRDIPIVILILATIYLMAVYLLLGLAQRVPGHRTSSHGGRSLRTPSFPSEKGFPVSTQPRE